MKRPAQSLAAGMGASQRPEAASPQPVEPLIVIEPGGRWAALDLRDLWSYRELLYFLVWRDIKIRYKQTLLGASWAIVQPLLTTLIFTLLFGVLAGIDSEGVPYPIFAYAGLLPWTFFANAVTQSSNSLVGSSHLITKVYFPRLLVPAAAVGAGLVDFGIAFVILFGMMAYYGVALTSGLLMLPALFAHVALLALGVGLLLSALNVKYRDVRHAVPFLIQLWMFASPVIYPPAMIPQRWQWVLALNPVTGVVDAFRAAIFGRKEFDWTTLAVSATVTLCLLVVAAFVFRRVENSFADVI